MIRKLALTIYAAVLRYLELAERRCAYCGKLQGWKYGPAFAKPESILGKPIPFATTHGICAACVPVHFPEPVAVRKSRHRPHTSRRNLRRRTGSWSGAVACRGWVS
jgi:hypothetical protein